jgi:hypothetical protein
MEAIRSSNTEPIIISHANQEHVTIPKRGFSVGFPAKILQAYALRLLAMRATHAANLAPTDLTNLTAISNEYKSRRYLMCKCLQYPLLSNFLGPYILPLKKAPIVRSSAKARDQDSRQFIITGSAGYFSQ